MEDRETIGRERASGILKGRVSDPALAIDSPP